MKITVIRHMESVMNKQKLMQGSIDSELSEKGYTDCQKLVDYYDFSDVDKIYCSEKQRTITLANMIGEKIKKDIHMDHRLNEIMLGEWEGKSWKNVMVEYEEFLSIWFQDPVSIPAPGGESYLDVLKRVKSILKDIKEDNLEHVVIVTHGAVIKTLLCHVLDIDLKNRSKFIIENGSVNEIEFHKKYKVKTINSRSWDGV